jgi:hypothetical protein
MPSKLVMGVRPSPTVNSHIYGVPAANAPVLHLRRLSAGDLFDTYTDSFERIWTSARPA